MSGSPSWRRRWCHPVTDRCCPGDQRPVLPPNGSSRHQPRSSNALSACRGSWTASGGPSSPGGRLRGHPESGKRSLRSGRPGRRWPDFGGDRAASGRHPSSVGGRSPVRPAGRGSSSVQQQRVDQCPKLTTSTCRPSSARARPGTHLPVPGVSRRQVGPLDGRRHDRAAVPPMRQVTHRRWAKGTSCWTMRATSAPGSGAGRITELDFAADGSRIGAT